MQLQKLDSFNWVIGIVAGMVLGIFLWLDKFGGWEQFDGWFSSKPTIEIRSASRPYATNFLVGEKLRFAILNANISRSLWFFDEKKVVQGIREVEYAFAEDPLAGSVQNHRIDAFVRMGDKYEAISKWVEVASIKFEAKLQQGPQLVLETPFVTPEGWALDKVSLSGYKNGKFVEAVALSKEQPSPQDNSVRWSLQDGVQSSEDGEKFKKLTASVKEGGAWVEYRFKDANAGEQLTLVETLNKIGKSGTVGGRR